MTSGDKIKDNTNDKVYTFVSQAKYNSDDVSIFTLEDGSYVVFDDVVLKASFIDMKSCPPSSKKLFSPVLPGAVVLTPAELKNIRRAEQEGAAELKRIFDNL